MVTISKNLKGIGKILQEKSQALEIYNIYGPPTLPLGYFCRELKAFLMQTYANNVLIVGDFNIDVSKNTNVELEIKTPTTNKMTLIDYIYIKGNCHLKWQASSHATTATIK